MNNLGMLLRGALLEAYVLMILDANPMHGYAVIIAIKKQFKVYVGSSTVYPLLAKLELDGYVTSKWNMNVQRPKKVYELTPKGKAFLEISTMDLKMVVAPLLIAQYFFFLGVSKMNIEELEPTELTMRELLTGHVHTRARGTGLKTVAEYPHLKFSNIEHYHEALAFAERLGGEAITSFKSSLLTVERISGASLGTAEVHPDSAQHSFYFRIYRKDGSLDMDGGIILHGLGQTFNVELTPKKGIYWSVHT